MSRKFFCSLLICSALISCKSKNNQHSDKTTFENDTILFVNFPDEKNAEASWKKENILVYQIPVLPDMLHPTNGKSGSSDEVMMYTQMYLVNTDMYHQGLRPQLVKSLPQVSPDGLNFTYELRDEVKWDNGEPLTADDIVFTVKTNKCPLTDNPNLKPYLDKVKDITVDKANNKRFTITMKTPYLQNVAIWSDIPVLQKIIYDKNDILSKFTLQQFDDTTFNAVKSSILKSWSDEFNSPKYGTDISLLNGLGMYRVSEWETGQYLTLMKKNNHWTKSSSLSYESSFPEKIIFRLNKDATSQMLEFKKQNYDASTTLSLKTLAELQQDSLFNKNYHSRFTNTFNYIYIAMNMKPDGEHHKKLFDDINVRKAMAMLIPYEQINKVVCSGKYKRQAGPVAQYKKDHNHDLKPIEFNIEEANKILDDAGWKDTDGDKIRDKIIDGKKTGFEFALNYYSTVPDWKDYVQIISEAMLQAGIKINPNPLEPAVLRQNARAHDFDMFLSVWNQSSAPEDPTQLWHTSNWTNNGDNYTGFGNAQSDALIDSIAQTLDEIKHTELSHRFQKMVADEYPYIFLFASQRRIAVHKRFGNCEFFFDKPGLLLNNLKLLNTGPVTKSSETI